MFHQGDLNSGISLAIQHSKVVACFINQPSDNVSQTWEHDYLTETVSACDGDVCFAPQPLGKVIGQKAVLLKIEYGSQEASFLGAFCPIDKAPMLVVVHNGQVLEKLESTVGREEFRDRLFGAVGMKLQDVNTSKVMEDDDHAEAAEEATQEANTETIDNPSPVVGENLGPPPPSYSQSQSHRRVQSLLDERAQRLEADHQQKRAREKAERIARASARRKEVEEASAAAQGGAEGKGKQRATGETSEKERARRDWVYAQKQRKEEAKLERERILRQIENDKMERRLRTQQGKEAALSLAPQTLPSSSEEQREEEMLRTSGAAATASSLRNASGMCSLQIRLFDGTSIRSRFPPSATLASHVRDWIKEAAPAGSGGADISYTFRQILAPNPSRSIEVSEEHRPLEDLSLVPTATLVLVPVAGGADAYAASGGGVAGYVNWAWGVLGGVSHYLPSFSRVYLGGTAEAQEASNMEGARMAGADSIDGRPAAASIVSDGSAGMAVGKMRVKTLADQRRAEAAKKQQPNQQQADFYNGNSLDFEGRKDDDEEGGDMGGDE